MARAARQVQARSPHDAAAARLHGPSSLVCSSAAGRGHVLPYDTRLAERRQEPNHQFTCFVHSKLYLNVSCGACAHGLNQVIEDRVEALLIVLPIVAAALLLIEFCRFNRVLFMKSVQSVLVLYFVFVMLCSRIVLARERRHTSTAITEAMYAAVQIMWIFAMDASPYRRKMRGILFLVMAIFCTFSLLVYSQKIPFLRRLGPKSDFLHSDFDSKILKGPSQAFIVPFFTLITSCMWVMARRYLVRDSATSFLTFGVKEMRSIGPRAIPNMVTPRAHTPQHHPLSPRNPLVPASSVPQQQQQQQQQQDLQSISLVEKDATLEILSQSTNRNQLIAADEWDLHYVAAATDEIKAFATTALNNYLERVRGRTVAETTFVCVPEPEGHAVLVPDMAPLCVDATPLLPLPTRLFLSLPWVQFTAYLVLLVLPALTATAQYTSSAATARDIFYATQVMQLLACVCVLPTYRRGVLWLCLGTFKVWLLATLLVPLHLRGLSFVSSDLYGVGTAFFVVVCVPGGVGAAVSMLCVDASPLSTWWRSSVWLLAGVSYLVRGFAHMAWVVELFAPSSEFEDAFLVYRNYGPTEGAPLGGFLVPSLSLGLFCVRNFFAMVRQKNGFGMKHCLSKSM
eukprot:PhM_4_TR6279/c2_g1_i2/m.30228